MVRIPDGMTEAEVVEIIDRIVGILAGGFRFGFFDYEEMKQEGRLFALEAIERFDPGRNHTLDNFLYRHVRNQYINLKRKKFSRNEIPCLGCPFYDPENLKSVGKNQCAAFEHKLDCEKWSAWEKRNTSKRNIIEPIELSNADNEIGHDLPLEHLERQEILALIDKYLDPKMRGDYYKWTHNITMSGNKKAKLIASLTEILKEHGYAQTEDD